MSRPQAQDDEEGEEFSSTGFKRVIWVVLATLPILLAVLAFGFIARSEMAFDEDTCPYRSNELRPVAEAVEIRQEQRLCQEDVAEHRWVLLREGQTEMELGRRRMDAQLFEGDYHWVATVDEENRVKIQIFNPGMDTRTFREPGPDEAH